MAKGKHPVPFRTRKLSPSAPMVLRGGPRGRGGRRRARTKKEAAPPPGAERPPFTYAEATAGNLKSANVERAWREGGIVTEWRGGSRPEQRRRSDSPRWARGAAGQSTRQSADA